MKYQDKLKSLHEYAEKWCAHKGGSTYRFKVILDDALRVKAQERIEDEWSDCGTSIQVEARSDLRKGHGVFLRVFVTSSICGRYAEVRARLSAIVHLERLAAALDHRISGEMYEI